MSGSRWYFAIDDQRQGPVSSTELRRLVLGRKLKRTDLVWKEGMSDWVEAGTIPGLFSAPSKAAKPPPAQSPSRPRNSPPAQARKTEKKSVELAYSEEYVPERTQKRKRKGKKRLKVSLNSTGANGPPGSLWRRAAAALIDVVLKWVLLMTISLPLRGVIANILPGRILSRPFCLILGNVVGVVTAFLLLLIYDVVQETSESQATMGKSRLGLHVTDLFGERIGKSAAIVRHFGRYLSIATLGFGFLMAAISPNRQTLHDRLAGTLVLQGAKKNPE